MLVLKPWLSPRSTIICHKQNAARDESGKHSALAMDWQQKSGNVERTMTSPNYVQRLNRKFDLNGLTAGSIGHAAGHHR
jgi:hypothetical protein